jgi:hypothetical protein
MQRFVAADSKLAAACRFLLKHGYLGSVRTLCGIPKRRKSTLIPHKAFAGLRATRCSAASSCELPALKLARLGEMHQFAQIGANRVPRNRNPVLRDFSGGLPCALRLRRARKATRDAYRQAGEAQLTIANQDDRLEDNA